MIDQHFRAVLPRYLGLIVRVFHRLGVTPNQITCLGFFLSLVAAYLVVDGRFVWAAALWWLSRLMDACDGIVARSYKQSSAFGAFLDIQLDMAAYSLMVLAFALRFPEHKLEWMLILLAYVLCITGALSLGSFEKEAGIEDRSGRGLRLASGLAEGGETGIMYTLMLFVPVWMPFWVKLWLGILLVTILARLVLARRSLS